MVRALGEAGARLTPGAPLHKLAFWRVGGPAELLVEVHTLDQLVIAMAFEGPITVLGRGSNALIHSAGIPGLTLRLRGELAEVELEGHIARVGGGLWLNVLLSRLDKAGLAGAEMLAGIPGTIGGAVVMNAGTTLGELGDIVEDVTVVTRAGVVVLPASACGFGYRRSALPEGVVAFARLRLVEDDGSRAASRQDFLERRKRTQPLSSPSCGSTFTNPEGDHAARLIDAAGLKGHRIGGAVISEKHANFFLNEGGATPEDIAALIRHARAVVRERFGVDLEPEVKLLGPWPEGSLG